MIPPTCQSCGIPLTVKHILVECANLRDIREKYFMVPSVTDLFKSTDNHTVINFIKETFFLSPTVILVTLILYFIALFLDSSFYHLLVIM